MVTVFCSDAQMWNGHGYQEYKSYLFGGTIQGEHKQLIATNDLILCITKVVTKQQNDFDATREHIDVKTYNKSLVDIVVTRKLETSGIAPMPRKDHSCILIQKNTQMLVYGGRNDAGSQFKGK